MIIEKKTIEESNSLLGLSVRPDAPVNEIGLSKIPSLLMDYDKDELVYRQGDDPRHIYLIISGSVKIAKNDTQGKEVVKAILNKGSVFGEKALSGLNVRSDYAQTITTGTQIKAFTVDDVLTASRNDATLNQKVIEILAKKLERLEKRLESITSKDSRTRVVDFLRDLALENGQKVGFETLIKNNFTHKDIASLTGTSRQTVTTTLNNLKEQNIINFDRRRILIRDMELLK
ncbi:MAG: Crp/Fnr family transcriptional regulator [Reichenbachiella sp.]